MATTALPSRASGSHPTRCRSASSLRPLGPSSRPTSAASTLRPVGPHPRPTSAASTLRPLGPLARPTSAAASDTQGLGPIRGTSVIHTSDSQFLVRSLRPTDAAGALSAWQSGGSASSSMMPRRSINATGEFCAVGAGLQAARVAPARHHFEDTIAGSSHCDTALLDQDLMHVIPKGTEPELPPGFARQLHPSPQLGSRRSRSPVPFAAANLSEGSGIELIAEGTRAVEGLVHRKPHETGRPPRSASSPDPYLRIIALSEWFIRSPLMESMKTSGLLSSISNVCQGQFPWIQDSHETQAEVIRKRLDANFWKELQELGRRCQVPMPIHGTPEELQIWALQLEQRLGTRRMVAFHRRLLLKEDVPLYGHRDRPSTSSGGPVKKRGSVSDLTASDSTDLVEGIRSCGGDSLRLAAEKLTRPQIEQGAGIAAGSDLPEAEEEDVQSKSLERAKRYDDQAKTDDSKVSKDMQGIQNIKNRDDQDQQVEELTVTSEYGDMDAAEGAGMDEFDKDLFRVKTATRQEYECRSLLPAGSLSDSDIESGDDDGKAVGDGAKRSAVSRDEYGLAPQFRRAIAKAWRPFTEDAEAHQARRHSLDLRKLASSISIAPQKLAEDVPGSTHADLAHGVSSDAGGRGDELGVEEIPNMFASSMWRMGEQSRGRFSSSSDLILQEAGLANIDELPPGELAMRVAKHSVDRYSKRLRIRSAKAVGRRGQEKWSRRADSCAQSLLRLEALSDFADLNCHGHLAIANAPMAA